MQAFAQRGTAAACGIFRFDHAHRVGKAESVWIERMPKQTTGGLDRQATDGNVREQEAPELLLDELGGLASKHSAGAPQMRLDLSSIPIQRLEVWVQYGGDRRVVGFTRLDQAVQGVVDQVHDFAIQATAIKRPVEVHQRSSPAISARAGLAARWPHHEGAS